MIIIYPINSIIISGQITVKFDSLCSRPQSKTCFKKHRRKCFFFLISTKINENSFLLSAVNLWYNNLYCFCPDNQSSLMFVKKAIFTVQASEPSLFRSKVGKPIIQSLKLRLNSWVQSYKPFCSVIYTSRRQYGVWATGKY